VNPIASLPILLIITCRPEFDPPWIGRPHVTAMTLNRLAEREVSMMIDRVVGNKPLPANVRRDIIERTDGVPLFVENHQSDAGGRKCRQACHRGDSIHRRGGPGKPARFPHGAP
jgi:hypothetical protein